MSVESEAILAAIGVGPILRGKPTFGQGQREDAIALPRRIRKDLLRYMGGGDEKVSKLPEFEYDKARDLLDADDDTDAERTHALYQLLPPDLADEVEADAQRIIAGLQQTLPRREWQTVAKVHSAPPEPFALGRFRRMWDLAMDPRRLMTLLLEDQVIPDDIQAFAVFWPELYAMVQAIADEGLATMKARRGDSWDLRSGHDRGLKVILGLPTVDAAVAQDYRQLANNTLLPPPRSASKPVQSDDLKAAEQLPGQNP